MNGLNNFLLINFCCDEYCFFGGDFYLQTQYSVLDA